MEPKISKQVVKYASREVNAVRADCVISREELPNGVDYVYVSDYQSGLEFYQGPQKKKQYHQIGNGFEEIEFEEVREEQARQIIERQKEKKNPKSSGKSVYVKVFTKKLIENLKNKEFTYDLLGICLYLTSFMEWNTGYLIKGRGKNRKYMAQQDLANVLKMSLRSVSSVVNRLDKVGVLSKGEKGYKFRAKFMAKGRAYSEDKI